MTRRRGGAALPATRSLARVVLSVLVAAALLLSLTGCATWGGFTDPHPGQVRQRPEIPLGKGSVLLHLSRPAGNAVPRLLLFHVTGDSGWHGLDPQYFDAMAARGFTLAGISARALRAHLGRRGPRATAARLADDYVSLIATAQARLGLPPGTPVVLTGTSRGAGLDVVAAAQPALARRIAGVLVMGLTADEGNVRPKASPFALIPSISHPLVLLQSTKDWHVSAAEARELFGPDTLLHKLVPVEADGHTFGGHREELFRAVEAGLDWIVGKQR